MLTMSVVMSLLFHFDFVSKICNCKVDTRELKKRGRQRERQKSKTATLHVHHAILYMSVHSLHDYNVKLSYFTS